MCNHQEKSIISVVLDDALDKLLEYSVPSELRDQIFLGSRVLVPVKNTYRQATVWDVKSFSEYKILKPIGKVLSEGSVTTKDLLDLAKWMAKYYCTPLHKVLSTILPSSIRQSTKEKDQYFVIKNKSKEEIANQCAMLRLSDPKQAKVLDVILSGSSKILLSDLLLQANVSRSPVETLVKKQILKLEKGTIDRSSVVWEQEYFIGKPKSLNQEQQLALEKIQHSLNENSFSSHLLFGVTGSGKTEVYLQAIEHALSQKKGIIFLIPEIILTSQTIERLKGRFKEKIALLHHRLSQGERHDTWKNILSGTAPIVIGARSALFSPIPNLGLIIVDEEHESSYKQTEESPCYHARDVAIVRAKLCHATIILGSATPSLESFENTLKGKYILSSLTSRPGHFTLPEVSVVDMKHEYDKKKGFTLFSDKLLSALKSRLLVGEQSLLLLNRRGYHSSQICLKCSHIMKCPHCDMNLTFHLGENILACHLCDFRQKNEKCCPNCHSEGQMKFKGAGTELVEKSLYAIFPEARILRMDADTTKKKGSHEDLCNKFKSGKADILIGTQMIAKGLHFPLVTLVGVLNADVNLQIPDFRASEHVFQLLTQVAGRSGRSDLKGEVVIQTMIPDNNILIHSSKQDFMGFYREEIEIRKLFHYPPFVHLIKCTVIGESQELTLQKAQWARSWLTQILPEQVELLPVTPCGRVKIQDQFRYQFLLKMEKMILIHDKMMILSQNLSKDKIKLYIDVDPLSTYF